MNSQKTDFDGSEIRTAEQIRSAWDATAKEVAEYFGAAPQSDFAAVRDGQWTLAKNLDHVTRSAHAVAKGLGYPKLAIRILFGPGDQSRPFMQLQSDYKQKLEDGAQTGGRFVPEGKFSSQDETICSWNMTARLLQKRLSKWNDHQLDNHRMPHPLLGKLTVREMLYFTIFHTQHHLANCRLK